MYGLSVNTVGTKVVPEMEVTRASITEALWAEALGTRELSARVRAESSTVLQFRRCPMC